MSWRWTTKKLLARRNHLRKDRSPQHPRLHVGCGTRKFDGFVNVDVSHSDLNLDLSRGVLPWKDNSFQDIVCQHVIEHLDWREEGLALLREMRRVLVPGGTLWMSCPDLGRVCEEYVQSHGESLLKDMQSRFPKFHLTQDPPASDIVNHLFHQYGQHKNLFDFELLNWCCNQAGFGVVEKSKEDDLLESLPAVARRNDDFLSLYIRATK